MSWPDIWSLQRPLSSNTGKTLKNEAKHMSSICFQISSKGVRNNEFNRKKKKKKRKKKKRRRKGSRTFNWKPRSCISSYRNHKQQKFCLVSYSFFPTTLKNVKTYQNFLKYYVFLFTCRHTVEKHGIWIHIFAQHWIILFWTLTDKNNELTS